MNRVEVTGRLTKDPKIQFTGKGTCIALFSLAENIYNKKEQKSIPQFHNVVAFGKTAELIGNTLQKGSQIHIGGNININEYIKDDTKHQYNQIILREFDYCGSKPKQ